VIIHNSLRVGGLACFAFLGFKVSAGFTASTALVPEADDLEGGELVARVALDGSIFGGSFLMNFPASSSMDIGGLHVERMVLIDLLVSSCTIRRAIVDFGVIGGEGEGQTIGHENGVAEGMTSALVGSKNFGNVLVCALVSPTSAERDRTGKVSSRYAV